MGREGFVGWASQQQSMRKGTGPPAVGVLGWPGGDRGRAGLWGAAAGCARHTGVPGACAWRAAPGWEMPSRPSRRLPWVNTRSPLGTQPRKQNVPCQGGATSPQEKAARDCFALSPPARPGPPGSPKGTGAAKEGLGGMVGELAVPGGSGRR